MAEFIDITADKLNIKETKGNAVIVFHIPGHCAGCKRAIETLKTMKLDNWTIYLVDAENADNKPLIDEYSAQIAPTLIIFKDGEQVNRTNGLKEFIQMKDVVFND